VQENIKQEKLVKTEESNKQDKHSLTEELSWLSQTTIEFFNFPRDGNIYHFVGKRLHELTPNSLIIITQITEETGELYPEVFFGLDENFNTVSKLLGYDPYKILVKPSSKLLNHISRGKLTEFPGDIHQIASGTMPEIVALGIEKLFGFKHIYVMGFENEGRLFGNVIIVPKNGMDLENQSLIEAFLGQAAVAIEHRRFEQQNTLLQKQLQQAQKMEAIGLLAGGVAHDINNMLSGIMSFASLLQLDLEPDNPGISDIEEILKICRNAGDLTSNLLGFARKGKFRKKRINLKDSIHHVHEILEHTISKQIKIEIHLENKLSNIEGDPSQIEQVLMNLSINAADAMGDVGTLSILARDVILTKKKQAPYAYIEKGHYTEILVRDTGEGMNAETMARAFEPFFTTKPQGQGTGLGLSMVYGTVKNHGGYITLNSEKGQGTTASILLPAIETFSNKSTQENEDQETLTSGRGMILLVDDEDIVRKSTSRLLKRMAYKVINARN